MFLVVCRLETRKAWTQGEPRKNHHTGQEPPPTHEKAMILSSWPSTILLNRSTGWQTYFHHRAYLHLSNRFLGIFIYWKRHRARLFWDTPLRQRRSSACFQLYQHRLPQYDKVVKHIIDNISLQEWCNTSTASVYADGQTTVGVGHGAGSPRNWPSV
jgi:hypothetical protein